MDKLKPYRLWWCPECKAMVGEESDGDVVCNDCKLVIASYFDHAGTRPAEAERASVIRELDEAMKEFAGELSIAEYGHEPNLGVFQSALEAWDKARKHILPKAEEA